MRKWVIVAVAFGAIAAGATSLTAWVQRPNDRELQTPEGAPIAARGLLYAQPFTLEQGYPFAWRAERPQVRSGWLLVIQTDPALCIPTQEYERVLFVGEQTAERINSGRDSGRIVAVVPAALGSDGEPADLSRARIFWGAPRLPEQCGADVVAAENARARSAGITPLSAREIQSARAAGGGPVAFAERDELVRHAAQLIIGVSPTEAEFARGMLAPRLK